MSHTKEMRRNRDDLTTREQVAYGAMLSEERWWTAAELAEAMECAQEHLPPLDRFTTTPRGAGQTLGFMMDMGLTECDPPRGAIFDAGRNPRRWKLVDSVYRGAELVAA